MKLGLGINYKNALDFELRQKALETELELKRKKFIEKCKKEEIREIKPDSNPA